MEPKRKESDTSYEHDEQEEDNVDDDEDDDVCNPKRS